MPLPLYKEIQQYRLPDFIGKSVNAGLVFDRFFDQYGPDCQTVTDQKQNWLKRFNGKAGNVKMLDQHAKEQHRLVNVLGGEIGVFNTSFHFVTGMGYPHPVENGLCWHPVYGTPYLTGAAVKGMTRAWLEAWEQDDDENRLRRFQWFGSIDKDPTGDNHQTQAGDIVFFDAVPTEPVSLITDIMTPHMGNWYEKGGQIKDVEMEPDRIPADWHDPVPIPFLAVKNATFLFSIAPRNADVARRVDLEQVMGFLQLALEWLGAGAKTAVGYGQMVPDNTHALILSKIPPEQQVWTFVDAWAESIIAKKFGKDFNKTKKEICDKFGEKGWGLAVSRIWETKSDLIKSWETKSKKTLEMKAYKKLSSTYDVMAKTRQPGETSDEQSM